MSETLTMNETPADQPQFNADEQDSLAVAENIEAGEQEQSLLAGKFRDAKALEQAYIELQQKLGQPRDEVQTSEDEGESTEQEQEEEVAEESDSEVINEAQAQQLMEIVGGEKAYNAMIQWASENLSAEEIEMYDAVMGKGEPNSIFFAIQALNNKYSDAVGSDGQMLTGRDGSSDNKSFRSQAELVEAMNDPRYYRDPAYRRDVIRKLENSDVQF